MEFRNEVLENLEFHPLTHDHWLHFEALFGEKGACGGCWCMWWRLKRSEFEKQKGQKNKESMRQIVESGDIPGILVYHENQPIGWCSVSPREKYPSLNRSRVLKPVDEKPVWSIVCFFIAKPYRKKGLTVSLLKYVVEYCRKQGAKIVEGYPIDPKKPNMPDVFAWTGFMSAFQRAGFKEVARRSETRPIMRYELSS
jgi:GNAT superfamily N-acetyltransferase